MIAGPLISQEELDRMNSFMSKEACEYLVDSVLLVHAHFQDAAKAAAWFHIPNPLLGGVSPIYFFISGRGQKGHRFIAELLLEGCRS